MAMVNTALRPGLYTGGASRLQSFQYLKARRWPPSLRCNRYPLSCAPTSLSCSSATSRMASVVIKAEASTQGGLTGGPPKGSSLTAEVDEEAEGGLLQGVKRVTPVLAIKWTAFAAFALTACRAAYRAFFTLPFGHIAAGFSSFGCSLVIGIWSVVSALPLQFNKKKTRDVKEHHQIILAGAFTWLILVPLGLCHGFIEGWHLSLFFVYVYFFLVSLVIKLCKHGELGSKV